MNAANVSASKLAALVEKTVAEAPVYDVHTHLYLPAFGELLFWGVDELLTYHYLVAEVFRYLEMPYEKFWVLSKSRQADLIWNVLFLEHSPLSESCRGVLTTLNAFGLDVKKRDLPKIRKWFAAQKVDAHVTRCMELAGVRSVCMTNSPFDDMERRAWEKGFARDARFVAALRIDPLLLDWPNAAPKLAAWGYGTKPAEARRFLANWSRKIDARFVMVSLPPDFRFEPGGTDMTTQMIEQAVLPHCREFGLPLALMPGVVRGVNPQLQTAGDGVGSSDLGAIANLCAAHPKNKFLATVLARENQHELCVLARKFRNLHIFGCWWFLNNPSLIEEITRMRLEMLGVSFTPQHSDARVLDQLIYKWRHSKRIIARVLADKYNDLSQTGWQPTPAEIRRDVEGLLGGEFERFCNSNP